MAKASPSVQIWRLRFPGKELQSKFRVTLGILKRKISRSPGPGEAKLAGRLRKLSRAVFLWRSFPAWCAEIKAPGCISWKKGIPPNTCLNWRMPSKAQGNKLTRLSVAGHHPPGFPAGNHHVLHALHRAHVLRPLERSGVRAAQLAHAALHLLNRFILVLVHPFQNALLN